MQHRGRHARFMQQRDAAGGDQRRGFRRLGHHRIAGGQRGRRSGPRKSPAENSTGLMQAKTPRPCSDSSLVSPVGPGRRAAPRSASRACRPRSSGRSPPPRALRRSHRAGSCRPRGPAERGIPARRALQQIGRRARGSSARAARPLNSRPAARAAAASKALAISPGDASRLWPTTSRRSAGFVIVSVSSAAVGSRRAAGAARAARRISSSTAGLPRSTPRELRRSAYSMSGTGTRGCAKAVSRSRSAIGSRTISATGTCSSMKRLTKEVLAPFSSRRRTR